MSTDEYTPDTRYVRDRYAEHARCYLGDAGERLGPEMEEGARAEFDRFLARVRRDAAREALDGVMERARKMHAVAMTPASRERHAFVYDVTERYRDAHYPEENP